MNNSSAIRNSLVILFAFAIAIWLGVSIVTNQTETILKVGGVGLLLACVFLGRKIWLLLIFFVALDVPLIRGFGTTELGQFLFIGFTCAIILLKRQPFNFKLGEKEFWMLLLALVIAQAYFRNPVGLNLFGTSSVGARPYFRVALAFATAIFLANIVIPPLQIKWLLKLSVLGSFLGLGLSHFRMGAGVTQESIAVVDSAVTGSGAGRAGLLGSAGSALAKVVVSFISPLRGLFHPVWAPLILFSIAAAAMSGYRNSVAGVGLIYFVGTAYRGGFSSVVISTTAGAMLLALLAFVNLVNPLPPNVQRALSPFPGTWEERHVIAADASTEWRVEMWKEALFTPYWIQNKLLGDGLGMTTKEMELIQDINFGIRTKGISGGTLSSQQETMMITGGYHSGPVQTIRTVGYVGLLILVLAMIRIAVHAHRQIIRCRGTEWYPVSLYIGVPAIVLPIFFVLIFGDFGRDVSALFFFYSIVSLLEKNLPLPPYVRRADIPYILNSRRNQPSEPEVTLST